MIESIYNSGYEIWNYLISIAMNLFTTSPTAANGSVYSTSKTLYNAISNISVPIAIVFFLIAIFKDVIGTPPEKQIQRFFGDVLKFAIMIGILVNLWSIMGYIMQIADGITDKVAMQAGATYELSMSAEFIDVINEAKDADKIMDLIIANIILVLTAVASFVILIAAAVSIVSCSFQRIIKPLVILPFSSITVAMASGSGNASRITVSYLKTFFGFCISGAFMVICVKLGVSLGQGLIAFDVNSLTLIEKVIYISTQNALIPLVIAGLVKGADSMIGKFF